MSRIPSDVLARTRLQAAEVRKGLEMILDEEGAPLDMDNCLAFIQRLLDQPGGVEWCCDFFQTTMPAEVPHGR